LIPQNKRRWFEHFFAWHVRRRFKRRFSAVRVKNLAALKQNAPILVVSNHTSWWDSLVFFDLFFRTLHLDAYAMMDARNLRKIPLLGWIGAFGVELKDKADGERAVDYAAQLLDRPGRVVLIFPQGSERPFTERPLAFKPGAQRIAERCQTLIIPVALRYEHGSKEKPEALVNIGDPIAPEQMEAAVTGLLDQMQNEIHAGKTATWPVHIA
jgi:1-acyl-sn-glycerol-3-phosphate acyltransferase